MTELQVIVAALSNLCHRKLASQQYKNGPDFIVVESGCGGRGACYHDDSIIHFLLAPMATLVFLIHSEESIGAADEIERIIPSEDIELAIEISRAVVTEKGRRPFAFYFPKKNHATYFLGGEIIDVDDIDPNEHRFFVKSMKAMSFRKAVVSHTNGTVRLTPFSDHDILIQMSLNN